MKKTIYAFLFFLVSLQPSVAEERSVPVSDNLKACVVDSDCEIVGIDCDMCCGFDAANKSKVKEYAELRNKICSSYKGSVCDCWAPEMIAKCENMKCVAKPKK